MGSTISPSKLAEQWGCKVDKVLGFIRSSELYAFNIATNPHGRPRWRIPVEAIQAFEQRRAAKPVVKATRRRRSQEVPSYV